MFSEKNKTNVCKSECLCCIAPQIVACCAKQFQVIILEMVQNFSGKEVCVLQGINQPLITVTGLEENFFNEQVIT